jgi:hypothetical protein
MRSIRFSDTLSRTSSPSISKKELLSEVRDVEIVQIGVLPPEPRHSDSLSIDSDISRLNRGIYPCDSYQGKLIVYEKRRSNRGTELFARNAFEMPSDVIHLNCAGLALRLKVVATAGREAIDRMATPWNFSA